MPHTPGDWIACKRGDYRDFNGNSNVILGFGGMRIAAVHNNGKGEGQENANLIAAAPDLLAACKTAVSLLPFHGSRWFTDIERAIAKAEGRES